jgi:hypothetical protein
MRRRGLYLTVAALAFLAFGWGLHRLFELRFSSGDIYPPSSSRRADPLGSKALLQSLARQPGIRVRQNLEPLRRISDPANSTLLLLGVPSGEVDHPGASPEENRHLLDFVDQGGRLVIAVEHESLGLATNAFRGQLRRIAPAAATVTNAPTPLGAELGFTLITGPATTNASALRVAQAPDLPATVPWTSIWHLTNLNSGWQALYEREGQPVAIQSSRGSGTVVVLASDYLLSNESLRLSPQPAFLSWLIGPARTVIFDETHLGLSLEPGIVSLLIKYRLGGAAFGFLLLAGLHVWRSMARFNPPVDPDPTKAVVQGRGSAAGLLNILRRSVAPADIVAVCLDEWRATHPRGIPGSERRFADAQDCLNLEMERPPQQRNPVDTYRRITQILRIR